MNNQNKIKVVFFGTPSFVIPVLDALKDNFNLVGVVTTPDAIQGRKKILTPSPIKEYCIAENLDIPIITSYKLGQDAKNQLQPLNSDLFVVAAFGMLVPKNILDLPHLGAINIHPSLLPKYRGPSPIQTTLRNGDTKSGVTFIKMDEEIDHGPILKVIEIDIQEKDTFATLHVSMFKKAAQILPQTILDYVDKKIIPQEQAHESATYCEHITKSNGYFDLQNPPDKIELDKMIRAYYPWPTAWTKWNGKIVKLLPEKQIQIEGKKSMSHKDFFNGHKDAEKIFGPLWS